MSEVFMSDGTLLKVSSMASPEVFSTIEGVMNITPPPRTRKSTDIYVHDQSAPITKTGAYEPMEVSFELAWDPSEASHQALFTAQGAKTVKNYKIVLPSSPNYTFTFAATVSQLEPVSASAEGTDPLKLNCVLKLSGDYTLA
jgi:hypothetical protein